MSVDRLQAMRVFVTVLEQKSLSSAAMTLGVSLPNTASTQELFNQCAAHGDAGLDHSGLVTALERMANHAVA